MRLTEPGLGAGVCRALEEAEGLGETLAPKVRGVGAKKKTRLLGQGPSGVNSEVILRALGPPQPFHCSALAPQGPPHTWFCFSRHLPLVPSLWVPSELLGPLPQPSWAPSFLLDPL